MDLMELQRRFDRVTREQRAENSEQRVESREQRAESREQRAESREQRALGQPAFLSDAVP
jgi:hypothetical protein